MELAKKAYQLDEVPVGCVVIKDGKVLSKAYNMVERKKDPIAHAEILAIREASKRLGSKFLDGCEVHVTLEPCVMCSYALVLARVSKVIFYALDYRHGGVVSLYNILDDPHINHRVRWIYRPEKEAQDLIKDFFKNLRKP